MDRAFRFGVHSSDAAPGSAWTDAARRIESLGFATLQLRDHFDRQLAPVAAMTAAAVATDTLRVGCLVHANDYRHPVVLAKELATIDHLSNGRVEIGLGAGWMAPDYEQSGMTFDAPGARVSRLEEATTIVKALFGGGPVTVHGDHYRVSGHELYPPPVQDPRPPIMIAGGGPRMLRFAAREADIVGLNPARKSNAAWEDQNLPDATAAATDRKIGWIREAAGDRYADLELSIVVPFVLVTDDREGTANAIASSLPPDPEADLSAEGVLASPHVLIGSVAQICETLVERRERWDLSYYVFNDDSIDTVAPIVAALAGELTMAHDLVVTNGTIVDGTGAPRRHGDVAIDGDRITAITEPGAAGDAHRTIDADGRYVTPGFVDLHSHLDAQIGWDPLMSSSCWHGVTSVVMGNCGMTFAPVRPGAAGILAQAMESVEDIPASCILDGLSWSWESYGEYLDVVDALPKGINTGGYVGDVALRTYVIGDAACEPDYRATDDELAAMAREVEHALEAGALGYSISRSLTHRVPDGRWVPGTWSDPREFFAIAEPLGRLGRGVLECAPRYNETDGTTSRVDEEMAWIAELSRTLGRPFTFNLMQMRSLADHYRRVLELATDANRAGAQLRPQTTPRGIGVLFSLAANTPIDHLPSFAIVRDLDAAERLAAIRTESVREALIADGASEDESAFDRMYLLTPATGAVYEYADGDSMGAQARAFGIGPVELYLDALDASDGAAVVNWPVLNEDFDAIAELLADPVTIMGLADAGAHATQIMDASQPTFFLSHWVRDRGAMTLEDGIRRLTSDTAGFVGYRDRGVLRAGAFADVNVIDLDDMWLPIPEIVDDFPGRAPRFVQRAQGIDHTIVNGQAFLDHGEHTGALAGRLLRSTD